MCGRFALAAMPDELMDAFEVTAGYAGPVLPADWNIAPTKEIYVVRNNRNAQRELATVSWGLIAPWASDETSAARSQSQAINARSETIHEKPTFRSAFRSRRCLIPATGYYEWATELGPYQTKQPFFIHGASETESSLMGFAGIWDRWRAPDGSFRESAAIITRPAVGFLATVHHRMPIFLPRPRWDEWLLTDVNDLVAIKSLMDVAEPDQGLSAYPVSTTVNSAVNNGPRLIHPIDLGEPQTLF